MQRTTGAAISAPVESRVDDDAARHERRAVLVVWMVPVRPGGIRQNRGAPRDLTADRTGVRIQQQFRRVAALPVGRRPGTIDAEPVPLARADAGKVAVPAEG